MVFYEHDILYNNSSSYSSSTYHKQTLEEERGRKRESEHVQEWIIVAAWLSGLVWPGLVSGLACSMYQHATIIISLIVMLDKKNQEENQQKRNQSCMDQSGY